MLLRCICFSFKDSLYLWRQERVMTGGNSGSDSRRVIGTNKQCICTHTLTDVKGFKWSSLKHLHHLKDESVAYKHICFVPWTVPCGFQIRKQQRALQTLLFPSFIQAKTIMFCMWRTSRRTYPHTLMFKPVPNAKPSKPYLDPRVQIWMVLRGARNPSVKLLRDLVEVGVLSWCIYLYTGWHAGM